MFEYEIEPGLKRILLLAAVLILVPLGLVLHWQMVHNPRVDGSPLQDAADEAFFGKVDSIYTEELSHGTRVALLHWYPYHLPPDWESQIEIGDSLSKKKGELIVTLYKKNGRLVILDYNKLVQKLYPR